jgi:phenylacetate-CoA ligase
MSFIRTVHYYNDLRKNLSKSREEILSMRKTKFNKLVKYAYENIPFYQAYYFSFGIKEKDLEYINITDLPVINKDILMDNFDKFFVDKRITKTQVEKFLSDNPDPTSLFFNKYYVIHSSGTSGKVGFYLYSKKEWDFIKAISTRIFSHFTMSRKKYAFLGAIDGHYAAISLFLSPLHQVEQYFYKDYLVMDINQPLQSYIKDLNEFKPQILTGYPNGIKVLAEFQKKGILNIYPENIVTGGEILQKDTKLFIKEVWSNAELTNSYATSESLAMGVAREDLDGMYIYDDAIWLEIQDKGSILTNLYNYTQPLIRYQLADSFNELRDEKSLWPFTKVDEIIGRSEITPVFINEDGEKDFIHPIVIAEIFVEGVTAFQFVQTSDVSFTFKIVISKESNLSETEIIDNVRRKLSNLLQKKKMNNVSFKIEIVPELKPDPKTGKFRLITVNHN